MNAAILPYLASPTSHKPLELTAPDQLREVNGTEVFPIVEGIPLLQPPGQFAECYNETLELIFQERSFETFARIWPPNGDDGATTPDQVLRDEYGPNGIREAFQRYAGLSLEQRMRGFVHVAAPQRSTEHPLVQQRAIESRRRYAELSYSEGHAEKLWGQKSTWASYLSDYAAAMLTDGPQIIVELGTGAGLGTNALIETGLDSARLITIDVDYACIGNAQGLARVYRVQERVDGIVASFWFLPLSDNSINVVCSHYGIDESREASRVIDEIARVLHQDGRFVAVCRTDAASRLALHLEPLGFDKQEMGRLARMANLYAGTDSLIETAEGKGLRLEKRQTTEPESGHQRDLLVFRKVKL